MTKQTRFAIASLLTVAVLVLLPRACTTDDKLYVHLTNGGQIMILPGDRLQTTWITPARLDSELTRAKSMGGTVLYSREAPTKEPSEFVKTTFARIVSYGMPITLVTSPHPDANRPPPREN